MGATGVGAVPVGIATADVDVVPVARVGPAVRVVDVGPAVQAAVAVVRVGPAVQAVLAEAEVQRVPMVQSSPGIARPGTKAVRHRVAELAGRCRVPKTNASMPTMPIPREALVRRAIRASTSAVLALRRAIVHRAAHVPKVPVAARPKAMADEIIVAPVPTVVRVRRTPPVVPVVAAVRATAAVALVRARADRKAKGRKRRAAIATGVVVVAVAGMSPSLPSRQRRQRPSRPSPYHRLRQHRYRRLRRLPKTPARPRRIRNPRR